MTNDQLDAQAIDNDNRQGERVANATSAFLARFIAYPSEHCRTAHVLWILHTHLMDRWDSTPRLAVLSPEPASGKSRVLEVSELLVPNPVVAVNVSPSYLFRKVATEGGATILYDEIDTVFGPKAKENEEIRGLLNAGHRRGAVAGRCVIRGKELVTEELPAYAPVALAGLGWLPDTIMTRSIVIRMRRRHAGETVEQFRRRLQETEGHRLKEQIETWAQSVPDDVEWPDLPDEIKDRDADVWEPLFVIANLVGGNWPKKVWEAAVDLVTSSKDKETSLGVRLLADIQTVFGGETELSTAVLLKALHELDESPWADLKGKPLDDRGLASRLRGYGIKSKVKWFGAKQARGYEKADFQDAWARYLPSQAEKSVTSVTPVTVCDHCSKPGELRQYAYGDVSGMIHRKCEQGWLVSKGAS